MKKFALIIPVLCCAAFTTATAQSYRAIPYRVLDRRTTEPHYSNPPTSPYVNTLVQAQMRMNLDKDTEQVHFIRDNNDPYVVTKTYVLKYADPYEIRPFVMKAVQSNRVSSNNTTVECIKYNDGTGALVVSAEEYRFGKLKSGMTIDQVVASLDKPKLVSSSGQTTFLYFPKYWAARDMAQLVTNVGANVFGDDVELQYGMDSIQYDTGLNAVLMYVPRYSAKNIKKMIDLYDCPAYDIEVTYKLYEIYAENDAKIGADFQAWKNNAGADLFSVGGRYRDGWSATWSGGANKSGSSNTSFLNFNPKWNTRYLDFLASKSKGKILTQGKVLVMTNTTATIEVKNNIFNFERGEKIEEKGVITGALPTTGSYVLSGTAPAAAVEGSYRISAYDSGGTQIDFAAAFDGKFTVTRLLAGNITYYVMRISPTPAGSLVKAGKNLGWESKAFSFSMEVCTTDSTGAYIWSPVENWTDEINLAIQKGYKTVTDPADTDYGFTMTISPHVNENSSTIDLSMTNDSLIGWKSDGSPRITRDTSVNTKVMVSNDVKKFVIGGMEKRSLVTTVTGVPYLKDIPFLGYLFSTESPTTKRSRLVMVLECRMQNPDAAMDKKIKAEIDTLNSKIGVGGKKLPLASQQYFIGIDK